MEEERAKEIRRRKKRKVNFFYQNLNLRDFEYFFD